MGRSSSKTTIDHNDYLVNNTKTDTKNKDIIVNEN